MSDSYAVISPWSLLFSSPEIRIILELIGDKELFPACSHEISSNSGTLYIRLPRPAYKISKDRSEPSLT